VKSTQITNFIKIGLVGAELFHADGQTYMTKLTDVFRNSADALKFGFQMYNFAEFLCSVVEECSVLPSGLYASCHYSRSKMLVI
jgi:hypothetical protein